METRICRNCQMRCTGNWILDVVAYCPRCEDIDLEPVCDCRCHRLFEDKDDFRHCSSCLLFHVKHQDRNGQMHRRSRHHGVAV